MFQDISLVIFCIQVVLHTRGNKVLLSPQSVDDWENASVSLNCLYEGQHEQSRGLVYWNLISQSKNYTAQMLYINNECQVTVGWLSNSDRYAYSCSNEKVFYLTLKRLSRQMQGEQWVCMYSPGTVNFKSNMVTVSVKVPVQTASIYPNIDIYTTAENSTVSFQCETFKVRPKPNFHWYLDNDVITGKEEMSNNSDMSSNMISNYSTTSQFQLNRKWNSRYLYCGASNCNDVHILSKKIFLNVTYPPDGPPRIGRQDNGSEVNVIKGRLVTLDCTVIIANPLPRLEWNKNNDQPQREAGSTVIKQISWLPSAFTEEDLICRAIHQDKIVATYVTVNVLYPPGHVVIYLQNKTGAFINVMKPISVMEGLPLALNCSAESNPPVSIYEWNGVKTGSSSYLHVPGGIQRNHTGNFTCKVFNIMQPTEPNVIEYGYSSTSLNVDVLYPPKVNWLKDMTLAEGEDLVYSCKTSLGNPNTSTFVWIWKDKQWVNKYLDLKNVSRYQSGIYQCTVSNIMIASDGDVSNGTDRGEFNLTVQYKSNVVRFYANEHRELNQAIFNENDSVSLTCDIEGDPLPTGEITLQRDSHSLNYQSGQLTRTSTFQTSTNLRLTTSFKTKCTDTGLQTCIGSNKLYNDWVSVSNKSLLLNIKCKPRQSPFVTVPDTVASTTSVDVTLSFTALAYPVPSTSGYVWSRKVEITDTWANITLSGYRTVISTVGLQSNLTIKDVSPLDYGLYRVLIDNGEGQFVHTFNLIPAVFQNDVTSSPESNSSIIVNGAVGTAGGVVVIVGFVIVIYYRKRQGLVNKQQNFSSPYGNVRDHKDDYSTVETDSHRSNVYQGLQHTDSDHPYQQLSNLDENTRYDGQRKVYENMQLTRITDESAPQPSSGEVHTAT